MAAEPSPLCPIKPLLLLFSLTSQSGVCFVHKALLWGWTVLNIFLKLR